MKLNQALFILFSAASSAAAGNTTTSDRKDVSVTLDHEGNFTTQEGQLPVHLNVSTQKNDSLEFEVSGEVASKLSENMWQGEIEIVGESIDENTAPDERHLKASNRKAKNKNNKTKATPAPTGSVVDEDIFSAGLAKRPQVAAGKTCTFSITMDFDHIEYQVKDSTVLTNLASSSYNSNIEKIYVCPTVGYIYRTDFTKWLDKYDRSGSHFFLSDPNTSPRPNIDCAAYIKALKNCPTTNGLVYKVSFKIQQTSCKATGRRSLRG